MPFTIRYRRGHARPPKMLGLVAPPRPFSVLDNNRSQGDFRSGALINSRGAIRQGMCGPAVALWQEALNDLARVYNRSDLRVKVDGRFGSQTKSATTLAQLRVLRITPTGYIDDATRHALRENYRHRGLSVGWEQGAEAGPCTGQYAYGSGGSGRKDKSKSGGGWDWDPWFYSDSDTIIGEGGSGSGSGSGSGPAAAPSLLDGVDMNTLIMAGLGLALVIGLANK